MLLLLLQKSNEVISKVQPPLISKVKVIVGVPPELFKDIACPALPAKEVQEPVEFDQEEFERLASKVPGATV